MQFRLILCIVLSWRGLSLINYFIDSNRPPHTIFKLIYVCNGAYNKGTLNVIINLWKKKCNEFWLSRHNFILLFCFLYGLLQKHQLVSIITFSIYFGRTCTYFTSLSHSHLLAITYARFVFSDMYNNLHFHQILRHTKPVVPEFKIRQNLLT